MDLTVLRKKISTFKGDGGRLRNVSDDVLYELLLAWENWTGSGKQFYSELGVSQRKMAKLIGRAKKLKREGHFPTDEFKEVTVENASIIDFPGQTGNIELIWDQKVIKFSTVDILLEFLQKAS
jgi:hypothetical protein